ncbi:MAG: sigma-54-dependent Fis family transcriptional regulator [Paludibacteraceae bacterium]|jgi:DNA-binding NtrC family response regulator|nr:sigma-54-dependent Fis family transcriptional regulator [Paludibacteraceae bacterium]
MEQKDLQRIKQQFSIIGNNAQLNRGIEIAVQVALTDLSVLITGESGVGKEHFPKIIHQYSARKHGPYFAVNCGAIPEGTIDSELFGHEKGAFTDAKSERKGYFEIADGGTLFLDEVGELPLSTQARLLRVLETGEFIRMGSSHVQKTNVRVVAATNLNIPKAIEEGRFREDLYYRLNTVEIKVPALRERKEDIPLLFRKFVVDFAERYRMPAIRLTDEATDMLKSYYWQGNVRQLKNVAEQISIIEQRREITPDILAHYLPAHQMHRGLAVVGHAQQEMSMEERTMLYNMMGAMKREINMLKEQVELLLKNNDPRTPIGEEIVAWEQGQVLAPTDEMVEPEMAQEVTIVAPAKELKLSDLERETIRQALERNGGNRKAAAAELGLSERTLYRKIKEYEL